MPLTIDKHQVSTAKRIAPEGPRVVGTTIGSALSQDPETRRALQLAALAAILPIDRRGRLAELLTDGDVETLKHLAREGMGENTLSALASDLAYLEAWSLAANGAPPPWPAAKGMPLKFLAHHLWDPAKREAGARHGMPADVASALRVDGFLRAQGTARSLYGTPAAGELVDPASMARHRRAAAGHKAAGLLRHGWARRNANARPRRRLRRTPVGAFSRGNCLQNPSRTGMLPA